MKLAHLFLFIFLWIAPAFSNAQLTPSYLKELEEQGYCVIPNVLSTAETEVGPGLGEESLVDSLDFSRWA